MAGSGARSSMETINMTEKRMKAALNLRKFRRAGIYPNYLDCATRKEKESPINYERIPFSSYYSTYEDYKQAIIKILDDVGEDKDLDDSELLKIARTHEEIGIKD